MSKPLILFRKHTKDEAETAKKRLILNGDTKVSIKHSPLDGMWEVIRGAPNELGLYGVSKWRTGEKVEFALNKPSEARLRSRIALREALSAEKEAEKFALEEEKEKGVAEGLKDQIQQQRDSLHTV